MAGFGTICKICATPLVFRAADQHSPVLLDCGCFICNSCYERTRADQGVDNHNDRQYVCQFCQVRVGNNVVRTLPEMRVAIERDIVTTDPLHNDWSIKDCSFVLSRLFHFVCTISSINHNIHI